jgi:hypothetical protein
MRSRLHLPFSLLPFVFATSMLGQTLSYNAALTNSSSAGFGRATLTINGDQATIDLTTIGLPNVTGLSLFQAAAGASGPLVQTFTDTNFYVVDRRLHRTLPIDPSVAAAIAANPQNYQLVLTAANPDVVLRGQLSDANTTYLAGTISGTSPICAGGIPNGAGSFVFAVTPDPGGQTFTVRYDVMTRGLGATLSSLGIGGAKSGPSLFTIGGNTTSSDGRFVGTNQISAVHARLLQTIPESTRFTVTTPATGIECAAAGAIRYAHEVFIPVAGTVKGIGNTNYMTDVNILNNTLSLGTLADVLMEYFPAGGSTAAPAATSWSTLTPRATGTYRDLSATAFPGITGIGALRIISADSVFANARIYNNLTATGGGTFGQFVPALPRGFALTEGTLLGLANASGSGTVTGAANARTNIGFFNPSETATTVAFELRNASGTLLAQRQMTLMPWMQLQMPLSGSNGLFTTVSSDVGTSSVYFLSGAPVFVYASVIDNPTGDASYVAPSTSNLGGPGAGQ